MHSYLGNPRMHKFLESVEHGNLKKRPPLMKNIRTLLYNQFFMQPRNLCILTKNGNLWILFMHGSTLREGNCLG